METAQVAGSTPRPYSGPILLLLLPYQVPTQLSNIAPRKGYQVREVDRCRKVKTDDDG